MHLCMRLDVCYKGCIKLEQQMLSSKKSAAPVYMLYAVLQLSPINFY